MSGGLPGFLRDRWADEEAVARAATPGPWHFIHTDDGYAMSLIAIGTVADSSDANTFVAATLLQTGNPAISHRGERWDEDAAHIARWDPARVLAEVDAKRRILAEHDIAHDPCDAHDADNYSIDCDTVRLLALPHASHPEYRQEWKP